MLGEDVAAASGGRITLDVKGEGEIVGAFEGTAAVSKGVLDMLGNSPAFDIGDLGPAVYLLGSSGFPGGPSSLDYASWFYGGGGKEIANKIYRDKGFNFEIIGLVSLSNAEMFGHFKAPITSIDNFKGMKFRTVGPWAEILASFGASVVSLPGAEVYEAAQRGVIDAFEYSTPSVDLPAGFHEVMPYIGFPGIHSPCMVYQVMVNKDLWNKLPADVQNLLRVTVEARTYQDYVYNQVKDAEAIAKYRELGVKFFTVPDDVQQAIIQRSREFVDKHIAEDPVYAEIWQSQSTFMTKLNGVTNMLIPRASLFSSQ
jgi:TRAP-type mannitol/chloroaromatic compound transport system substrate-binding protein